MGLIKLEDLEIILLDNLIEKQDQIKTSVKILEDSTDSSDEEGVNKL